MLQLKTNQQHQTNKVRIIFDFNKLPDLIEAPQYQRGIQGFVLLAGPALCNTCLISLRCDFLLARGQIHHLSQRLTHTSNSDDADCSFCFFSGGFRFFLTGPKAMILYRFLFEGAGRVRLRPALPLPAFGGVGFGHLLAGRVVGRLLLLLIQLFF